MIAGADANRYDVLGCQVGRSGLSDPRSGDGIAHQKSLRCLRSFHHASSHQNAVLVIPIRLASPPISPPGGVQSVARPLSGHGIKREDDQQYAAQGPSKQSRCLLFSHKATTMELNKCSGQFSSRKNLYGEPAEPERIDSRFGFGKDRAGFPRPRARSRSARRAKQVSPCFGSSYPVQGGAVQEPRSQRYVAARVPATALGAFSV
jgi:hypothetical protein